MHISKLTCVGVLAFISSSSFALTDGEKKELTRISYELQLLNSEVREISTMRREDDRQQFNYEQLVSDLAEVQEGIERVVNETTRRMPSKDIRGDYGHIQ